jgi:methionine-rich copper-binding protein CopC
VVGPKTRGRTLVIVKTMGKSSVLAVVSMLLFFAAPAAIHAHAELTSSNPADGSALAQVPETVELTFSEDLLADTVEIAVTDSTQTLVDNISVATDRNTVTTTWPTDLPGGEYKVAYRVVSNDGHPITGVISFSYPETVATESEPSTEATTEDSPAAVPSDQSSTVQDTPEPELISVESTDDEPTSGISPIWLIIIGLGIGAVIGFVMLKRGASRASKN